ncbi:hypothetical protein L0222_01195 [bacterium]|nr:hypothetical protein [bacterium]MCI0601456.1 hypothetical protein [bacterium]
MKLFTGFLSSFESNLVLQVQQQNESRENGGRTLTTIATLNGGGEMKIHLRALNGNIEVREN